MSTERERSKESSGVNYRKVKLESDNLTLKFFKDPFEIKDECVKVKEERGAQPESGEKMVKVDEQLTMEFEDACETKIKIEKEPKSSLHNEDEQKAKVTITNPKHCQEEIPRKSNDDYNQSASGASGGKNRRVAEPTPSTSKKSKAEDNKQKEPKGHKDPAKALKNKVRKAKSRELDRKRIHKCLCCGGKRFASSETLRNHFKSKFHNILPSALDADYWKDQIQGETDNQED